MEKLTNHLESLCHSELWDNNTVYSDNPDFTFCFQQTILIWTPCFVLILISPLWIYMLTRQITPRLRYSLVFILKIICTVVLIAIEICNLYKVWSEQHQTIVTYMSPLILILTYMLAMFLMNFERIRGLKTSSLLLAFWLLTLLASCIRLRSLIIHYINNDPEYDLVGLTLFCIFFSTITINTLLSLVGLPTDQLEFYKEDSLKALPENHVSLLSKLWFHWINELILIGYKRDITREDLWRVEESESSEYNTKRFEFNWNKKAQEYITAVRNDPEIIERQNSKHKKTKLRSNDHHTIEEKIGLNDSTSTDEEVKSGKKLTKPSFGWALVKTFSGKFLAGSFLKIVLDIFQFVGPIILDKLIHFINDKDQNFIVGIFYTILLFVCSLFRSFVAQHYVHRLFIVSARIRTAVINVVFKKSLKLSTSARKQATVGEMTNLVAVNAQTCSEVTYYLNEFWSAPIQMIIAVCMLYQYLGISALIGLVPMIIFIPVNLMLANRVKKLHTAKLKIQDSRIKMMNEILGGIKVLKFYGWELSFQDIIQNIRKQELNLLKKIGLHDLGTSFTFMFAPLIMSVVSFGSFVLIDKNNELDASTAFVSLSLFNILRFPMVILPGIISALINANVSLKRIRDFLLKDEINVKDITFENIPNVAIRVKNADLGYDNKEAYLKNLNFEVKKGELVAVVGEIGNGKSSLLYGILGEMHKLNNGMVNLNGSTAYVAQQAWIQNATVKENILFGRNYDEIIYNEVLQASCLVTDLNIMPAGDMTEIGEKGINLSGGQKQRVSLARSLYADADIYFLDDPLSAVDSHVGKDLFDQVIGPNGMLNHKTRVFVTNSLSFLPQCDKVAMIQNGSIVQIGTYEELLNEPGKFKDFIKLYLKDKESNKKAKQDDASLDDTKSSERNKSEQETSHKTEINKTPIHVAGEKIIVEEKIETGMVNKSVLSTYFRACGYLFSITAVFMFGLTATGQVASNVWLSNWSNDAKSGLPDQKEYRLGVYAVIGVIQCVISVVSDLFFLFMILNGARILHNKMLSSIMRSTMEFFESTPSGRVINRFSKDVDAVERSIPNTFESLLRCLFTVFYTVILITVSTPMFLITLVPIAIIYIFIQRYFVALKRQLKRLESASKSPIFSHFSESLVGVSTIRAFKCEKRLRIRMQEKIDENLLYYFPNNIANNWLALRLELIGNLITVFAALFAVIARNSISAGMAGLSITYSLNFPSYLNWLVNVSTEFETNITSAERIEEYCNTPHEAEWSMIEAKPAETWPDKGHIEINDYSVKYRQELDNVLNNISADIKPGEKIGIVGRTGAGKSSLSLGLFRILEYSTGQIKIDNVDIKTIGLHDLRHKLTIIPQDPVLFSGTLRVNLDPFGVYTEQKIWEALELAHLKQFISGLEKGLEFECSEGGENLSVGQRQLICLARALLKKTKILLLDEATASVDHNTDELIQKTIRKEFADCTILTVAHRLNTILDSSRIMVLDKGKIIEFDTPEILLSDIESSFYSMAKDAGLV